MLFYCHLVAKMFWLLITLNYFFGIISLNQYFFFLQKQLLLDDGQNVMIKKVLDTYMLFFQINQSTATLRHVFAALRLFVQKVIHLNNIT